jgi:hypothetical protein
MEKEVVANGANGLVASREPSPAPVTVDGGEEEGKKMISLFD